MGKQNQSETIRAFISINLPFEIREAIGQFQETIGHETRGIRWTRPENCHLTLKFLGDTSIETLSILEKSLSPLMQEMSVFPLELYGVGQFPPKGQPSVVWIGVMKGASPLTALEQRIRESLLDSKIAFDKKKFKPHLTIGRAMRNQRASVRALKDYSDYSFGTFQVNGFSIMQSVLQKEGPMYYERLHFPLAPLQSAV